MFFNLALTFYLQVLISSTRFCSFFDLLAVTCCCILLCRLLKVSQQLDQFFMTPLIIRSVGVEKDLSRSIMCSFHPDLVTAHVEGILILPSPKRSNSMIADHIRILELAVILSRMQLNIYSCSAKLILENMVAITFIPALIFLL